VQPDFIQQIGNPARGPEPWHKGLRVSCFRKSNGHLERLLLAAGIAFDHAIAAAISAVATAEHELVAAEKIGHLLRIHLRDLDAIRKGELHLGEDGLANLGEKLDTFTSRSSSGRM